MTEENGRATIREVYDLVGRLGERIDKRFDDVDSRFDGVDERLRTLEDDKTARDARAQQVKLFGRFTDRTLAAVGVLSAVAMGIVSFLRS